MDNDFNRTSRHVIERGDFHPLGATVSPHGVNFAIFSENASRVELLLFDAHDARLPYQVVELDPREHRSFRFWHVFVRGLEPGAHYAFRMDGPSDLHGRGHRFDARKVLVDPYARGITMDLWDRRAASLPGDNTSASMRCTVVDLDAYDWEGDRPLDRPMDETIIYELHVGGFTRSPTSGTRHPGTFAGLVEKIPYLQSLGITAVELMPIMHFDPAATPNVLAPDGSPLANYWGYSPVGFFAPHCGYCVAPEQAAHITEFRNLVKALHRAGIEVILDVVFNHTSEGDHEGPTFCFKGIENGVYYHLEPTDRALYRDYSGCGNTVNCNHPIVDKLIVECLEYWVHHLHVDGFRFDQGSILARGESGEPLVNPPVVWHVELSDELADTKIIAEAWDAAGLSHIGFFPGDRWAEWNGRYRDDIRRFVRGDRGIVRDVANRIAGSPDLFDAPGHSPVNSINFVTCHDGFTLLDLVSYNEKHNLANGEGNRDGIDENTSWNCGVEGPTSDPAVIALRERQVRNFLTILMLSRGVPMLLAGDERGRTQQGNNNAYCQDNPVSWVDWSSAPGCEQLLCFVRDLIAFRKRHPALRRPRFFSGEANRRGLPDVSWHGCALNAPGWNDPNSGVLALTLAGFDDDNDLHVVMNMEPIELEFELPIQAERAWSVVIDTSDGLCTPDLRRRATDYLRGAVRVPGRSIVVLESVTSSGPTVR